MKKLLHLPFLVFIFGFVPHAHASVQLVQSSTTNVDGTSATCTLSPTSAGNLLLVLYRVNFQGVSTFSDTKGDSFIKVVSASNAYLGAAYAFNTLAGNTSITMSGFASTVVSMSCFEYSGVLNTADPFDGGKLAVSAATTMYQSGPVTTTGTNDLLVGQIKSNTASIAPNSPFSQIIQNVYSGHGWTTYTTQALNQPAGAYNNSGTTASFSGEANILAFKTGVTSSSSDTTAPNTPTNLTATVISSSQSNLSWSASTDTVGVTGYRIYRDGTLIASLTTTSYSDTGLSSATSYAYTVTAIDAVGNESAQSASTSATTSIAIVASSQPLTPTYYVDQANPVASDTNAGTAAMPFKTIQRAANIAVAGDTVIVKAGIYHETVTAPRSGTAGNLITFKASDGESVVINGDGVRQWGFSLNGRNFIRVQGFELTGLTGHPMFVGWSSAGGTGIEIIGNSIHDNPTVLYGAGVYMNSPTAQQLLIEGNHIYNNAGDGIGIPSARSFTLRANTIHDNGVDGFKGGASELAIIEGNTIHSMTSGVNHGDCMQLMGMIGTTIVRNNTTWDCTQNIFLSDYSVIPGSSPWGDVYIYNNVVINTQPGVNGLGGWYNGIVAGTRYNNLRSLSIYGNTLINLNNGNGGIAVRNVSPAFSIGTLRVFNNLFYNSINGVDTSSATSTAMDYNAYFNQYRPWYLSGFRSFTQFRTVFPAYEQHGFYAPISFINYPSATPDFHSTSNSPIIGKGIPLPPQGSVDFATDRDSRPRPQGAAWDIGAYQYVSPASATVAPTPTTFPTLTPIPTQTPELTPVPTPTSSPTPDTEGDPISQLPPLPDGSQGSVTTTPPTTPSPITRPLYRGTKGDDVKTLQTLLIHKGHLPPSNDTGFFGLLTRAAVQKYQCSQNIICGGTESSTGYGVAGPKTIARLSGGAITNSSSTSNLTPAQADAIISILQSFNADASVIASVRRALGR